VITVNAFISKEYLRADNKQVKTVSQSLLYPNRIASQSYIKKENYIMADSKYGEYFITDCIKARKKHGDAVASTGLTATAGFSMDKVQELFPESKATASGLYFTQPQVMVNATHLHDFDEYLLFLGTNPLDINDFEAEIELYMGKDGEIHLIKSPTAVYVPAGLVHCPLKFVKITKPVFFFHFRIYDKVKK
jgi:hypothetical protein